MTDATAAPSPELVHELEYNLLNSAVYNVDFKGRGRLVIRPAGPAYVFSGQPRGFFADGKHELVFGPGDIANASLRGRTIQFKTRLGRSGEKKQPFAFHLRDEAEARAVFDLLPHTLDQEYTEARDFAARLAALPESRNPWASVTNQIVALNVAMFVLMGCLGAGWLQTASMQPYFDFGANNGAATTDGEWWRLLTSMLVHYGIMHLFFNMWALFQAGHFVEKLLGRWPYALTYLGAGLAGGFASIAWHGDKSWSAGASGAVFGVYGAIFGYMLRQKTALPASIYQSLLKSTLTFAGYNILFGVAQRGVDNAAHVGGMLGGIAFSWIVAQPLDPAIRRRDTPRRLLLAGAALVVLVALGVGLTPRFDYRVRDVLAWEAANEEFSGREDPLLAHQKEVLAHLDEPAQLQDYIAWVEREQIPFYESWIRRLNGLTLDPQKATARARHELVAVLQLRLDSYQHLVAALRRQDPQAFARFRTEDAAVDRRIAELQAAAKP